MARTRFAMKLRILAVVAATGVTIAAGSVASAAEHVPSGARASGTPTVYHLYSSATVSVLTSTHQKLGLLLSASSDPQTPTPSVLVGLVKGRVAPGTTAAVISEEHAWTFLESGSFAVSGGSARMTLGPGQVAPYGSTSLHFFPFSHQAERCISGSGTIYKGTLTGSLMFHTGIPAWGSVNSPNLRAPGSQLVVDHRCMPVSTPATCETSIVWTSPAALVGGASKGYEVFEGAWVKFAGQNRPISFVTASRQASLPVAKGKGGRFDMLEVTAPPPKLVGADAVRITTYPHSQISGGATLTALGKSFTVRKPCGQGGRGRMQTETLYYGQFAWSNASPPVTPHMVNGAFNIKNNPHGYGGSLTMLR